MAKKNKDIANAVLDESKVSETYLDNFNNIKKFIDNKSKLGSGKFSKQDSAILTPLLMRMNEYYSQNRPFSQEELENSDFIIDALSRPISTTNYERNGESGTLLTRGVSKAAIEDKSTADITNKLTNLTDSEIKKMLDTDYNPLVRAGIPAQIKKLNEVKPDDYSLFDLTKIAYGFKDNPLKKMGSAMSGMRSRDKQFKNNNDTNNANSIFKNGGYLNMANNNIKYANGGYIPSYAYGGYNNLPQHGFGSWLKDNSQAVLGGLTTLGGAALTAFSGGALAPIGVGMMSSGVGMIGSGIAQNQQMDAQDAQMQAGQDQFAQQQAMQQQMMEQQQQAQQEMVAQQQATTKSQAEQSRLSNLTQSRLAQYSGNQAQQQQNYSNVFANGGMMSSYKNGGFMEGVEKNPNVTYFNNGGTHEQSPLGGIPIGNKGRVEEGEFKAKIGDEEYIFSNRF